MEDKNQGRVVLSDEELNEVVGGTSSVSGIELYCDGFDTREECESRYLCQWGQVKCHPHPRANAVRK